MSSEILKVSTEKPKTTSTIPRHQLILHASSLDLSQFPTLCKQYYQLVCFLSEIYPEKVLMVAEPSFSLLMSSLELGLNGFDTVISRFVLDSLYSLASKHLKMVGYGPPVGVWCVINDVGSLMHQQVSRLAHGSGERQGRKVIFFMFPILQTSRGHVMPQVVAVVRRFLEVLFKWLLFETFDMDLLELASHALFATICCDTVTTAPAWCDILALCV